MADPWFKFFQNDWLVTQGELSSDEQLVFLTVLVLIYDNDKPIVTDAEAVSRRCKLSVKRVEAALVRLSASPSSKETLKVELQIPSPRF